MSAKKIQYYIQYSVLIILISFLFIGGPQLYDSRSIKKIWDLGHIILFALMFFIILRDLNWLHKKKLAIQFIIIIVVTIVLGIIIEWVQLIIGRTSEFIDIWRNVIGTLIAFVYSKKFRKLKRYQINIARIVVSLLVIVAVFPLIKVLIDEVQAQQDFPIIADFENPFEIEKWYGKSYVSINDSIVFHGKHSLKAELITTKYSGISISFFPSDWSHYKFLKFNVYNPYHESFPLTCRVHDKKHNNHFNDRLNRTYIFIPGWNEIIIELDDVRNAPENRLMNMKEIKNFALFAVQLKENKTIYFDYMRLE